MTIGYGEDIYYVLESNYGEAPNDPDFQWLGLVQSVTPKVNGGIIKTKDFGHVINEFLATDKLVYELDVDFLLQNPDFLKYAIHKKGSTSRRAINESMESIFFDVNINDVYYNIFGGKINRLTLSGRVDENIRCSCNVIAKEIVSPVDKNGDSYPFNEINGSRETASTHPPSTFIGAKFVWNTATPTVLFASDFSLEINNNLNPIYKPGFLIGDADGFTWNLASGYIYYTYDLGLDDQPITMFYEDGNEMIESSSTPDAAGKFYQSDEFIQVWFTGNKAFNQVVKKYEAIHSKSKISLPKNIFTWNGTDNVWQAAGYDTNWKRIYELYQDGVRRTPDFSPAGDMVANSWKQYGTYLYIKNDQATDPDTTNIRVVVDISTTIRNERLLTELKEGGLEITGTITTYLENKSIWDDVQSGTANDLYLYLKIADQVVTIDLSNVKFDSNEVSAAVDTLGEQTLSFTAEDISIY